MKYKIKDLDNQIMKLNGSLIVLDLLSERFDKIIAKSKKEKKYPFRVGPDWVLGFIENQRKIMNKLKIKKLEEKLRLTKKK